MPTTTTTIPDKKAPICHATGSQSNPFVMIEPSVSGVFHGHLGASHQDGRDIIPPFVYQGVTYSQNWDATGQAIFANGCVPPATTTSTTTSTTTTTIPDNPSATICHATGVNNEFETLTLPATEVIADHIGQHATDIVPPFFYDNLLYQQNWDATGQAIWNNNCEEEVIASVSICHYTGVAAAPYELLPTLTPEEAYTQHYGVDALDIIPPFVYNGQTYDQRWPEGQELLDKGCVADITTTTSTTIIEPNVTLCHYVGFDQVNEVRLYDKLSNVSPIDVFTLHYGNDPDDIIPPFTFQGGPYSQNWTPEFQAIYDVGCVEDVVLNTRVTQVGNLDHPHGDEPIVEPEPEPRLPFTGSDPSAMVALAGMLIAAGGMLMLRTQRRRYYGESV
jgi:hypothetical protein